MAKKRVFISFDYDDNKHFKFLLNAWSNNSNFDFEMVDRTPPEIQSDDIPTIKANLTKRIKSATHTLVIVGKNANKRHPDWKEIGYRNWINFEVAKSKEHGKKLVGAKINKSYDSPQELLSSGASWAMSFKHDAILKALNDA